MALSRGRRVVTGSTINWLLSGALLVIVAACAGPGTPLRSDGSSSLPGDRGPPATVPDTVEWRFSDPQPDWKARLSIPGLNVVSLERTTDALRVTLSEGSRLPVPDAAVPEIDENVPLAGSVYVDLPDWGREEWAEVIVSARTTSSVGRAYIGLNPPEGALPLGPAPGSPGAEFSTTFETRGGVTPIIRDGQVHTYRIHPDWGGQPTGPWRRFGLQFVSRGPGSVDLLSVRVVPSPAPQANGRVTETLLEPPQLNSDFALFRRALEEAHPDLYHYTSKPEMDAVFARAEGQLTRPMTILQFHNVLAPVLAAIKDGHIGFRSFQGDEISTVLDRARQFPLALTFESERAFVVLNQGLDERVIPGMEVLGINGTSLPNILRQILPNLSQDGDIRTGQLYGLGFSLGCCQWGTPGRTGFSEAYRLYIGDPSSFQTTLRDPVTQEIFVMDLAGVTVAEAVVNAEQNPVNRDVLAGIRTLLAGSPRQSIRYLDGEDTAILNPGFGPNFPAFLEDVFAELRGKRTKNLIVDMRGNGGGQDTYPVLLISYLTSNEFRAVDRVHMATYQPSFEQYTDRVIDPATDPYFSPAAGFWEPDPSGGWLMTEKYPTIGVQSPAENHFEGAVYVLIDGGSFSAGALPCAPVDFCDRATFIGEETGGAGYGTGGGDIGPTLPESLLHFNIPQEAAYRVAKGDTNDRRGTLPDHTIRQTVDDLARGRDTVFEFTRALIRSRKER